MRFAEAVRVLPQRLEIPVQVLFRHAVRAACKASHHPVVDRRRIVRRVLIVVEVPGEFVRLKVEHLHVLEAPDPLDELPLDPDQVVIDVGINWDEDKGGISGDADFDAVEPVVRAITPVPGGVGTVTSSVLVSHVIEAARRTIVNQ